MTIDVNINVSDAFVGAVNKLADAINGAKPVRITEAVSTAQVGEYVKAMKEQPLTFMPEDVKEVKEPEPVKADTDKYYYHAESDSYFMIKKGEDIPTGDPDFELSIEISKEKYEGAVVKNTQEPEPVKEETKPTEEEQPKAEEPSKQEVTYDMLFERCTNLIQQGGKPAADKLLEIVRGYGCVGLPDLKNKEGMVQKFWDDLTARGL